MHCKAILSFRILFVKNGFRETSGYYLSIKGFHVYRTSPDIGKKLKFVLEETNRHTNTAIKDANETMGHIPDGLSKVVAPALKKEIVLSVDAEVTGHPRDAAEGKWTLGGRIEVPCIYRFYGPKKSKAQFRNKLSK